MIDALRDKMHAESEERVREGWKSKSAQRLLDAYYKAKARMLGGGRRLHTPEEWAGGLMVVHGNRALEALTEARRFGVAIPRPSRVRRLLKAAVNDEVAAQHGEVTCHACGKKDVPNTEWRCRQRKDEDGWWWACPSCAPTLAGPAV